MNYIIYLHVGRKLYKDKYRIDTIRLSNWDYSDNGEYFITIRTRKKGNILGEIIDGKFIPNIIGIICDKYLNEIPMHFPNVILHEKVVMPDHVHMLLEINKRNNLEPRHGVVLQNNPQLNASRHGVTRQRKDNPVEPCHGMALQNGSQLNRTDHNMPLKINRPQKGSISIIINQLKGAVKRYCNENGLEFAWQQKFYDRIIRSEEEFQNTIHYILNNPKNTTQN